MAQYFLDAEERRRVSMALSVRHETAAKFTKLRSEIWTMLIKVFHKPDSQKTTRDKSPIWRIR